MAMERLPLRPDARARALLVLPLLLACAAAVCAPAPADAQITVDQLERDPYRPTISPRHGPPQTAVTMRASELPPTTIFLVGVGVVGGGGHQMVGEGESDADGNFSLTVQVPDWAEPGTSHYFFLAYADQRPRALADVFLVSDADGVVRVRGDIVEMNGPCGHTIQQGDDLFALVGETGDLTPGGPVTVEGTVVLREGCEDRLVIDVQRVVSSP